MRGNQAPQVMVSPTAATVDGDEELALFGSAIDPEGDSLTHAWTSSGGGTFDDALAFDTTWTAPAQTGAAQNIVLTLAVTDDGAGRLTRAAEVRVTVRGDRPPAPIIFIGGGGGPSGPTPSEIEFEWNVTRDIEDLDGGHDVPTGSWSDGATLWLAENGDGADDAIYAYDLASGERVQELEFELDDANLAPRGVWSNLRTIWISASGKDRLFAHDLGSGERLPDSDLALHPDNDDPRGIWSGGSTLWVLDDRDNALFGYDLESGELLAEYALDSDNDDPHGIWSDGVSVWVSDHNDKRLFAYRLPSLEEEDTSADEEEDLELERVRDEEFWKLPRVSNNSPRGLWSDGDVMYVADESDDKVYTYNMPDAIDARLALLTLSGVEIGEFSSSTTVYSGVVGEGVTETTVGAVAAHRRASVSTEPTDAIEEAEGHQVALEGVGEMTVTVISADGSRERVYRVRLGDPEQAATGEPGLDCFRGDIAVGFSLVFFEGGSIEELEECAKSRHVATLYALDKGAWVPDIIGAPEFVNRAFGELFPGGVPPVTALIAGSSGPPSEDPVPEVPLAPGSTDCLRGEVAVGFSIVIYSGGSVEELTACARGLGVATLYALDDGAWFPYIIGAPAFVNRSFVALYAGGLSPMTPLVAKSDGPPAAGPERGDAAGG